MVKGYYLEVIVFFSGMIIMILEIVGSRIVSPYVGTSIIVWTALISVILGCLSIGYFWGGSLADKKPDRRILGQLFLGAGIYIGCIKLIERFIAPFIVLTVPDIRISSLLLGIVLFGMPSVLLGAVTPVAAKLKVTSLGLLGKTTGMLYASSTVGSIVGTLLAGFYLLPIMGHTRILFVLSFVCMAFAFVLLQSFYKRVLVFVISGVIISSFLYGVQLRSKSVLADRDTEYNRVLIREVKDNANNRMLRILTTDAHTVQSAFYVDNHEDLVADYIKLFTCVHSFRPSIKKVLMIGGAGFSYPKYFLANHPEGSIDVVEIDPAMTDIAKQHFYLPQSPKLRIFHEDGRMYLQKSREMYDVIFLDAYAQSLTLPFHLVTREAISLMKNHLYDGGLLVINTIGSIRGQDDRALRSIIYTMRTAFADTRVYPRTQQHPEQYQNIVVFGFGQELPPEAYRSCQHYEDASVLVQYNDALIFTDDYAPVEFYAMKFLL